MPSWFADQAKIYINIPNEIFKNTYTLLNIIAFALAVSTRGTFNGAITNASLFSKVAALALSLKISSATATASDLKFSGATAIVKAFFSDH